MKTNTFSNAGTHYLIKPNNYYVLMIPTRNHSWLRFGVCNIGEIIMSDDPVADWLAFIVLALFTGTIYYSAVILIF